MKYFHTTAYDADPKTGKIFNEGAVCVFQNEIFFYGTFGKFFIHPDIGLPCQYFFQPKPIKVYPQDCNVKVVCETDKESFVVYLRLDENEVISLKIITKSYWVLQPEFQKKMLHAILGGSIGGVLTHLLIELLKR